MKQYEILIRQFDFYKYIDDICTLVPTGKTDGLGFEYKSKFCPFCNGDDFKVYDKDYKAHGYYTWSCDCLKDHIAGIKALEDLKKDYYDPIDFIRVREKVPWDTARNKLKQLVEEQDRTLEKRTDTVIFSTFDKLLKEEPINKPKFLVDRLLYKKAINLLVGDPKTYKTYIAIDILTSIITGEDVFQTHTVNEEGTVLFISPEFDTKSRIYKSLLSKVTPWNGRLQEVTTRLHMPFNHNIEFIGWSKDGKKIAEYIREIRPTLVILDPLTYIFDGEIEKNEPVKEFFKELKELIRECDTTFLITHHTNRMNVDKRMNKVSGSSSITRYADCIIYLERLDEDVEQDINKSDEELNAEGKDIKLIKGEYRHGGEGYKYHKITFTFEKDKVNIVSSRYSNKEENGFTPKNIPRQETYKLIEREIMKAIQEGKLGIEFTKDNVLSVINNYTGKAEETFKRYVGYVLPEMVNKGIIVSRGKKGYSLQTKL